MIEEIDSFKKRFDIPNIDSENIKRFKVSLSKILENELGNVVLRRYFRDEFVMYTGIDYRDRKEVNKLTVLDFGQKDFYHDEPGANYIKFSDTYIGQAFKEDLNSVLLYLQIILLIKNSIVSSEAKKRICNAVNEIIEVYGIDINIKKVDNKYLIYPKGAKELDEELVNKSLEWLKKYDNSRNKLISALEKYQRKDDIRSILDDLRLSLELFIKQVFNNDKSLENNKSEIGNLLKNNNINVEIANMYNKMFDYYTKYQDNNVKHNEQCYEQEVEFVLYQTCILMRTIITIVDK